MKVRYHRVSTAHQSNARLETDKEIYDRDFFDRISGKVNFKDRPQSRELCKLISNKLVNEVHILDLSRLGRNTSDVISTLEWMEEMKVNVVIKNIGLHTRPNGESNPIAPLITSILSSIYSLERQNIIERCSQGLAAYQARNGILGRRRGSTVSDADFMDKPRSKKCLEYLKKGRTIRETAKLSDLSTRTVQKVKKTAIKLELM